MEPSEDIPEFGVPRENEERRDGGCAVVFDPATRLYAVGRRDSDGLLLLFSGGVEREEHLHDGILREVREESGLYDFLHIEQIGEAMTHYRNKAKNVNRIAKATFLLIILRSSDVRPVKLEPHEQFVLAWATPTKIFMNWNERNEDVGLEHWIYYFEKAVARVAALGYT